MSSDRLKILMVASEMAPFAKVGGLADVVGSLPKALRSLGHDVRVAMPGYKKIPKGSYLTDYPVQIAGRTEPAIIRTQNVKASTDGPEFLVYFVDSYRYFFRDQIYADEDEVERFVFFAKAVLEMLPKIGWKPDVIHCNDWQTGALPFLLKNTYAENEFYRDIATIYTIHNLQYQGVFPRDVLGLIGAGARNFHSEDLEFYGGVNFTKTGLIYADKISTVSRKYSQEIQRAEFGERLDGVLRKRSQDLYGILNGIDYEEFDPATDPRLVAPYSSDDMRGKAENKRALQQELGLKTDDVPLYGLISRLVDQKGLDLIGALIDKLMHKNLQIVVLGTGEPRYERLFRLIGEKYPDRAGITIGFDVALAQRIYAGSDLFLMPSRFEPCGLGQLISLRYGTIPLVRHTGGLADTISDFDAQKRTGNGFVFSQYSSTALLNTIDRSLGVYSDQDLWLSLVKNAMSSDFSWSRSAHEYVELYHRALKKRAAEVA